ncbi:DNA polymerase [Cupriavidus taiwanensis]|uniref:DNA polymerase n=1 Tax=Cupriavidus taiwanensis TaxID=164546 RepID=UPI000E10E934|nr:DNA polymerase [Cupriavidus taiwanensis]SPA50594.1 DNA polymerase I domain protein [Cupriavidus taiwanensis]
MWHREDHVDDILSFDLETDGFLKELTRIWVMAIGVVGSDDILTYTDHDPAYPSVAEGIERLRKHRDRGGRFVAHNGIGFDLKAIRKVSGLDIPWTQLWDTMVLGRLRNPERPGGHSLESYGVELGILKGSHNEWDRYSEAMRSYNAQDIAVTNALFLKLKPVLSWGESALLEHYVAYLIDLQMENGFPLNMKEAIELAAQLWEEREGYLAEMQRVFPPIYVSAGLKQPKVTRKYKDKQGRVWEYTKGAEYTEVTLQEFNPGSEYHIDRRLFRKYGFRFPLTKAGNPNVTEKILKKLDFPEVQPLIKYARVDKMWTQVASPPKKKGGKLVGGGWIHHADENDRVHGYVNSNGAVTGRMTHRMPNSANIDKDARMRALWIPGVGYVMVGCDAEGLELRVLAHYLYPFDKGRLVVALLEGDKSKGTDAHSMNRDSTELPDRDSAKTLLYAAMYGSGDPNLGEIWLNAWRATGKPIYEWPTWAWTKAPGKPRPAKVIGKIVREKLVGGMVGFGKLIDAIKKAAKERGYVKGIDGRRIRVRSQHAALNSLLQGTGAIIMKKALCIFHDAMLARGYQHGKHWGYLANVHDECQMEVLPELAQEVGALFKDAITRAGEHFNFRCRLDGAYDVGANWHETH